MFGNIYRQKLMRRSAPSGRRAEGKSRSLKGPDSCRSKAVVRRSIEPLVHRARKKRPLLTLCVSSVSHAPRQARLPRPPQKSPLLRPTLRQRPRRACCRPDFGCYRADTRQSTVSRWTRQREGHSVAPARPASAQKRIRWIFWAWKESRPPGAASGVKERLIVEMQIRATGKASAPATRATPGQQRPLTGGRFRSDQLRQAPFPGARLSRRARAARSLAPGGSKNGRPPASREFFFISELRSAAPFRRHVFFSF